MGYYDFREFSNDFDDRECIVCKAGLMYHSYYGTGDHPFITDNLQFLEWKLKQKEEAVAA